jgi:hypothetical protein
MEPKFQTSFIPKKPVVATAGSSVEVIHETNPLSIIAGIVFIVSILVSGGLFGYKIMLNNAIEQAGLDLDSARSTFQLDKIQEMLDANSRITSAKELLESHIVSSEILYLMHDLTVKQMQLKELVYKDQGKTGLVTIQGSASSYNALAQQGRIFDENEFIRDERFFDFNPGENGLIDASFAGVIDPSLISFKNKIESSGLE